MKLICNKSELQDAVSKASRAVSPKSTIAALEGILVRATRADGLFLCGYNLDLGIICTIAAAVKEEGEIVLPSKMFCDIVRRLPADDVCIEFGPNLVTVITSGTARFETTGMAAVDYPALPDFVCENTLDITHAKLKTMIGQTRYAIGDNPAQPVYTGARFELNEDNFRIVAIDGHRIAIRTEPIANSEPCDFIVPGKTLVEVEKMIGDSEEIVNIAIARHHVQFAIGRFTMISRLLSGKFLDYRNVVKVEPIIDEVVTTRRFLDGCERMSLMLPPSYSVPVKCFFGEGTIRLESKSDLGYADDSWHEDSLEAHEINEIWFKNAYLLDALRAVDTDLIRIQVGESNKPLRITPPEGDSFEFFIMPVRKLN